MKLRSAFTLLIANIIVFSLAFAGNHDDCSTKKTTTTKSSCGVKGLETKQASSKTTEQTQSTVTVLPVGHPQVDNKNVAQCVMTGKDNKQCVMDHSKTAHEYTDKDKDHCDMTKVGNMTMKTGNQKMNCCSEKGKGVKAEKSKQGNTSTDSKGTN